MVTVCGKEEGSKEEREEEEKEREEGEGQQQEHQETQETVKEPEVVSDKKAIGEVREVGRLYIMLNFELVTFRLCTRMVCVVLLR